MVPRRAGDGGQYKLDPQTVLFHEYAHHFMLQNAAAAYPQAARTLLEGSKDSKPGDTPASETKD